MELSPILLSELLFYSFLWGMALGALNDVSRIIRVFFGVRYSKRRFDKLYLKLKYQKGKDITEKRSIQIIFNVVIFFQDLVLTVVAAAGIVILSYYLNDGEFRVFCVAAMAVGAMLWYMSFGKIVMAFSEPIAILLKFLVITLIRIIYAPIRAFATLIMAVCKKFFRKVKKTIANKRNIRYNKKRKKYYADLSRGGFMYKDALKG